MICREWTCRSLPDNADRYERLLTSEILPSLDEAPGCLGAYVLRRSVDEHIEFSVLHLFESHEAVLAFAGEDYEFAVVPAAARPLLSSFDRRARHYEVRAVPNRLRADDAE
ncbi:antibiotic biosynthesis monooxygenase family protein [Nocardia brasiliensis]|uniref:antibiotic biosynthesis monooxygenase family protein n=1 Tax=Nocardia brasiliensis TaxID=37326 RepID=UPI003D94895D